MHSREVDRDTFLIETHLWPQNYLGMKTNFVRYDLLKDGLMHSS